jgi:hypothetical protein
MADEDDWSERDTNKRKPSGSKRSGPSDLLRIMSPISNLASLRKGGKTRKDGPANLHKNERVIPANKRKKVERLMKREKMALTNRKGKKRGTKRSSARG